MKRIYIFLLLIGFVCFCKISNVFASTTYIQGIVNSQSAIKSKADSSSSTIKSDANININLYSPEAVQILGSEGSYYQIKFLYNGFLYTGYIPKSKVTATTYTTDDNYQNSLINLGFPSDYAQKLAILHAIHPNWIFTPKKSSDPSFQKAVNNEREVVDRNLISGNNTSLRSTADGAYSNGVWTGFSGGNWYAASEQTISYYLDPRNFLDESHIFMFENLGYNAETQTETAVNKVIGTSFMSNPFTCYNYSNNCTEGMHTFSSSFMSVGKDLKVSPIHLASRVYQEQGYSGSVLSAGNGYNGQYVGYYNLFNISANGKTKEDVIINGLKYAYNRGWNNQHASILGGAGTIANGYVNIGQSTLYYQKFNTINLNYAHQYQQNIQAPYTESYSTYTSYYKSYSTQNEWNNALYDFLIPVYTDMPSYTTLDTSGNADSTLKSLTVSACSSLSPSFQSSAYYYDCYVPKNTSSVQISASATSGLASVTGDGTTNLTSDDTGVNIIVTSASGSKSTYTILIHRIETDGYSPNDIMNGIGIKTTSNYAYNLTYKSDISDIMGRVTSSYHFASVQLKDASGNNKSSGIIKTGDQVTITNAGNSNTYNIIIYGDTSGDGNIDIRDLLVVQKHLVKAKILTGAYEKSADINKDGQIDIRDLLLVQKNLLGQYTITQG